ncbi:MAG: PorV/PorQ family protein, partial [Bacteroidales bacterium]
NKLALSLDLNKLLVPAPPMQREGETEIDYQERMQNYRDMSPIKGIFKSFGDRSFSNEIKEINLGIGAEYSYNDQFFARMGYHYESEMMGNRRFFSFGAGVKLNIFQVDASYLVASQNNPLDQTFRISIGFDLGGIRGLMR